MRRHSIRQRLLIGVAVVQVAAALIATALVVHHEKRRSYALLEAGLVEHAAVVESVIQPPDEDTGGLMLHRELLTLPRNDVYVLSDATGAVLAASSDWRPAQPLPTAPQTFFNLEIKGKDYRGMVLHDVILVSAEPDELAKMPKLTLVYASRISEVRQHVRHVALLAAGIGLLLLLASLAATGWVVRAGLRPVVQLAGRAARIDAAHWNFPPDLADEEADELVPLSTALSHLVDRLRAAFERERQFSADAAHEMKTSVAIIKSTLQLTLDRERTGPEYRSGMERALEDTERLHRLVSSMLRLAKLESLGSRPSPEAAPLDMLASLARVESRLTPLLDAREIQLQITSSQRAILVRSTSDEIDLALTNLLENAILYSPLRSSIRVNVSTHANLCALSVADAGCGIEASAMPHIFERFYRGDPSRSRESGGNGLGLAIVKAIVERAGGSVHAESTPAQGSVFNVTLPLA